MDIFTALAVPTRRNIIEMLSTRGNLSATDIYDTFDASHPAISQHLKVLRESGLVLVTKNGQRRMYRLNIEKLNEFERWAQKMTSVWNQRFNTLEKILEVEKKKLITIKKKK